MTRTTILHAVGALTAAVGTVLALAGLRGGGPEVLGLVQAVLVIGLLVAMPRVPQPAAAQYGVVLVVLALFGAGGGPLVEASTSGVSHDVWTGPQQVLHAGAFNVPVFVLAGYGLYFGLRNRPDHGDATG